MRIFLCINSVPIFNGHTVDYSRINKHKVFGFENIHELFLFKITQITVVKINA